MDNQKPEKKLKIAIIGTGLIGCSIADGLRVMAEETSGVDNNAGHLQEALSHGLIDRSMPLEKAVKSAGLVIVTVPVDKSIDLIPKILDHIGPHSVVIDAGSVKTAVCRSIEDHPKRSQFVAAHPMAGLAASGPDAADANIFHNRKVIICEHEKSSGQAMETASMVFKNLGMNIIFMSPETHDIIVARVSHLPQIIAYCLAAGTTGKAHERVSPGSIASTGYESSTRLASSPANMWIPIFQHNSENLAESLDDMIALLSDMRNMIKNGQWKPVKELIEKANKIREDFLSEYKCKKE